MRKIVKKITAEGKRLKLLLKQEGIKQKEFAKLIGLTPSTVSDFMYGRMKGGGGIKFWDGIRGAFPNWENKIRDDVRIPPQNYSARPGSAFGTPGIVICGYDFRNSKTVEECLKYMWHLEQLTEDLLKHEVQTLKRALHAANIILKKIENQSKDR